MVMVSEGGSDSPRGIAMGVLKICFLILVSSGYYVSAQTRSYKCDFEQGSICSFLTNSKDNKENWRIGRGKLNAADTGPSVDHTTGTANGTYLFVNVSASKTNEVSLQTVALKKSYCVRFFYHMYGADIGSLTVSTQSVSQVTETKRFFYRTRTQGDRWKEAFFTVTESGTMKLKGYRIIFTAKHNKASSVRGDIALDDIELTPGKCKDTKRDVTQLCTFDDYDCGYSAGRIGSINWEWKSQSVANFSFKKQPDSDHTLGTSFGGYWFIGEIGYIWPSLQTTILSSSVYKKPKTNLNCLQFYYYIDGKESGWVLGKVKEAYIQATVNYPNSKEGRMWLTTKAINITNHRQWIYVEVKANISADFQFQFVAGIDSQVEVVLAIDDIKLVTGNCPEAGFCDFEEDKCTWKDGPDLYNWVRKNGRSRTNSEIGPSSDNTLKTADGNYVVFSTENKTQGSEARLESEFFPPNDKEMCLTFFYHMSGADLGTLKVLRREENVTESTLWFMRDDQGEMWKRGMAVMKPSILYNQIIFRGVTGEGINGFMALDDIRIRTGEKCELLPPEADPRFEDLCTSNPCLNDGNCTGNETSFECACPEPFFGERCEEDPCISNPCLNNGICAVNGNSFKCSCWTPFFGDRCEDDPCASNPCLNDGNCTINGNSFKCSCREPFFGEKCEEDPCTSDPCRNAANCTVNGNSFKCACREPFFGEKCEEDPCTSNPCLNGGICTTNGTSYKCACWTPFFGDRCEDDHCTSNPCLNDGNCTINGNSFKCTCGEPFFGEKCEKDPCTSNPCLHDGNCSVNGNSFKCACRETFFGKRCEEDPCTSSPCLNDGICIVNRNSFKCACWTPFIGDRCEEDPCATNPCLNDGNCSTEGNSFKCACRSPFLGDRCEEDPCTSNPCLNDGICTVIGNSFKCACREPFFGERCEEDPCTSLPCLNNGICTINWKSFKCDCREPFFGERCEEDKGICNDDVCVHGKCEIIGQFYRCRCDEGFTGLRCEDRIQTKSDKQVLWQIIQTSIMFCGLILLTGVFCLLLRWKK